MNIRRAACDPCRRAKVACDHKHPVCTRCMECDKASSCTYRASPFKRRRLQRSLPENLQQAPSVIFSATTILSPKDNAYPNPGHLGSSSHVTLFNEINPNGNRAAVTTAGAPPESGTGHSLHIVADLEHSVTSAGQVLKEFLDKFTITAMKDLVLLWLANGVNLALAEPFVKPCTEAMNHVQALVALYGDAWHLTLARHLLQNSAKPLSMNSKTSFCSFTDEFCGHQVRWETLGIFLVAVVRATLDIPMFSGLYTTETERYSLQRSATRLSKRVLELCLSLDCLNDLQLVLQYENFIVISYIEGFHCWRTLGDVIASTFALGYHENIQLMTDTPPFLLELRKTVFARIYSADKNVAIFLGRPPRMSKRFSYFQIPSDLQDEISESTNNQLVVHEWHIDAKMSYRAETRWSALCASLKEEILELFNDEDHASRTQKASAIANRAEAHWQALPPHFVLNRPLKQCIQSPFERDFLASTKLNHLHVLFLIRLVLLKSLTEPDDEIVEIAQQILSLVVEAILFRDQLGNSGTGLVWKIIHYGLPAAGVILLALLKKPESSNVMRSSPLPVWQELSILVAEVQMGSTVRPEEPNYALLSKATETIQSFLESTTWSTISARSQAENQPQDLDSGIDWSLQLSPDPWNLELAFWQNLGEHPFLLGSEPIAQDLT